MRCTFCYLELANFATMELHHRTHVEPPFPRSMDAQFLGLVYFREVLIADGGGKYLFSLAKTWLTH
jgi:hypothetical protein